MTTSGDAARVTVVVAIGVEDAFDVFTREIDLWWRSGPRYREAGARPGKLTFEPGPAGRVFETYDTPGGAQLFERGRVVVWAPPRRLVLTWRLSNFGPDEETEVEVTFEPVSSGTRVTVQHRGWSKLPLDHPARHGRSPAESARALGLWWSDLATALRLHVARRA